VRRVRRATVWRAIKRGVRASDEVVPESGCVATTPTECLLRGTSGATGTPGRRASMSWGGTIVLVLEGQYGVDVRSMGRNPANRDETKMTERNACTAESIFQKAAGTQSFHGIWSPEWPASSAERMRLEAIERYAEYSTMSWCARGGNCGP